MGVLPIFQSPYLSTIGRQRVLSLGRWTSQIQTRFHVSGPTRVPDTDLHTFVYGAITLYGPAFLRGSTSIGSACFWPHNPAGKLPTVWAISRSLAATEEVAFAFFSWWY